VAAAYRVAAWPARTEGVSSIEVPVYDRDKRAPFAWKAKLPLAPNTILIFEGVAAALSSALLQNASLRLWADVPSEVRRGRFLEHYRARGYDAARATQLFAERESEEVAELNALRSTANWAWDGSHFQAIAEGVSE